MGSVLAVFALASDSPKEYDDRAEYVGIEGTWQLILEEFIQGSQDHSNSDFTLSFHKGEWTGTGHDPLHWPDGNPKGYYKVDTAQLPWRLDWTTTNQLRNRTFKGIFRIEGDTLKLAQHLHDNKRPVGFVIKDDPALYVETYKRVQK
jgi:uncharacterized protein (TIGR03067 family)